jgi:hypothetical protein
MGMRGISASVVVLALGATRGVRPRPGVLSGALFANSSHARRGVSACRDGQLPGAGAGRAAGTRGSPA